MEKENKIFKLGVGITSGLLLIAIIAVIVINNNQKKLNNNQDQNINQEIENEEEYIPYETKLPEFADSFEKALFVYSWFYDNGSLLPYVDRNNAIEDNWYLLKAEGLSSIEDMKKFAYDVFDKDFIDGKFNAVANSNEPGFKEIPDGVILMDGYVKQNSSDMGYSTYKKTENSDGTITYKVEIKADIMGDEYSCNTTYEYKMIKNNDGKLVFNNFENPATICLNASNNK